jgi:hypothetical protein
MYCDTPECASRETELIIMRGEGAYDRADERALNALDEGEHVGDEPPPTEFNLGDPHAEAAFKRAETRRVEYRSFDGSFTLRVP